MNIGESKEKFVKGKGVARGMVVKTTLMSVVRKRHKKTGGEYLSQQFKQEWK